MSQNCDSRETLFEIFKDERKAKKYGAALQLLAQTLETIDKLGGSSKGVSHLVEGLDILSLELKTVSNSVMNKISVENMLSELLEKK